MYLLIIIVKAFFLSGINILRKKFHGCKSKLIYMYINNVSIFLYVIKAKKKCDKIMIKYILKILKLKI
jgi:hypothetical protein